MNPSYYFVHMIQEKSTLHISYRIIQVDIGIQGSTEYPFNIKTFLSYFDPFLNISTSIFHHKKEGATLGFRA